MVSMLMIVYDLISFIFYPFLNSMALDFFWMTTDVELF